MPKTTSKKGISIQAQLLLAVTARITAQIEETEPTFNVPSGPPQGSPVSPILFLLFIQYSYWDVETGRGHVLGYADDVALLATSSSLEENNESLAKDFQEVTEWAQRPVHMFLQYRAGSGG